VGEVERGEGARRKKGGEETEKEKRREGKRGYSSLNGSVIKKITHHNNTR